MLIYVIKSYLLVFSRKLSAVHLYVDGLCFLGGFKRLYDLFLYGDHTGHDLTQRISKLVRFLGGYDDMSFVLLAQCTDPAYEVLYGPSLNLGIL